MVELLTGGVLPLSSTGVTVAQTPANRDWLSGSGLDMVVVLLSVLRAMISMSLEHVVMLMLRWSRQTFDDNIHDTVTLLLLSTSE